MVCDIPDLRRVLHSYLVLHNRNHEPLLPNAPAFMLGVDQGTSLYFICIKYIGRIPNNQHINLLKIRKNRINFRLYIIQYRIHERPCRHLTCSIFQVSGVRSFRVGIRCY
nr:MAG TPA: hypothetical protein [Caudoviricetes sp.]